MIDQNKWYNIQESIVFLKIKEREIYWLFKKKKLVTKKTNGHILISGKSLIKFFIEKHQRIPEGYTSLKDAAYELEFPEDVLRIAIYRKELVAVEYRRGYIIENSSLMRWEKSLLEMDFIEAKEVPYIEIKIKVKNKKGLHLRPSKEIVKISRKYLRVGVSACIYKDVKNDKPLQADSNKLLQILGLRSVYGEYLRVRVSGPFSESFIKELKKKFRNFDKYKNTEIEGCKIDCQAIARDIREMVKA